MTRKELYSYINAKREEERRMRLLREAIERSRSIAGASLSGMPPEHNNDKATKLCNDIERIDYLRVRYNEAVCATNSAELRLDSVRIRLVTSRQKAVFNALYYAGHSIGETAALLNYSVGRIYQIRSEIDVIAAGV